MSKQANAIDISEFQDPSTFDYQAAKDAGIDTLIIRAGYHTRQDKHVKEHIANAKQYGFNWHLYHYWMNGDNEAEWAIQNAIDLGLTSKQYLFLDMEDKTLSTDWNGQFMQFRQVASQTFHVGLYCSDSPYKAKFDDDQLKQLGVMRWVASYSYEPKNYDIWQMSGAGGGGFGKYTKDVDRDYMANSTLNAYAETTEPDEPVEKPFTPPTDLPESIKNIVLQDMVVDGIRGLGCSADNGVTNRIYWTILGRKYYQEDGDRIWPFLVDKVKAVQSGSLSVSWDDIQNKPDIALKSDIPAPVDLTGYAKKSDIPSLTGYAKLTDIPSVTGLVKEAELDDYAKKKDLPDLSSYATTDKVQSLIDQKSNTINESIVKLDSKVNGIQIGGRSLAQGTDKDIVIDDTSNKGKYGYKFATVNLTQQPKVGDKLTVSAEGTLTGKGNSETYDVILYNSATTNARSDVKHLTAGKRSSATLSVTNLNGNGDTVLLIYAGNIGDTEGKKNVVHHLKVEFGNVATDWSPAPEDLLSKSEAEETYAKKSNIPTSMAWQNITDKPDVATKSDIPTSIDWDSVTNKPDLVTSAGLPKDLVHTTDLDKTNQKVSDVESTANQALSVATNGQSIATDAQNEAQSVSEKVETLTNQLNSANQVRTITSGTLADLENKNGQYHYEIDFVPSDSPSSSWGMCDVTVGPHYAKELFTVTGATENNGRAFVRVRGYDATTWNDWREVTLWS